MDAISGMLPRAVIERMPMAEAAQWLLRWCCDPERLQTIWDSHRGRGYDKVITFPTMVHLIGEALLQHRGSGRRTFEKAILSERLDASVAAAFGKLGRLPLAVSQAFLRDTTATLGELVVPAGTTAGPASLAGMALIILDGKVIKNVAKRLKPLRGVGGGLIGGKALVAVDDRTGLAVAMETHLDGDHSENLLVPGLLAQVRPRYAGPRLFLADRGFGNLVQAEQFTERGDHFLLRMGTACQFHADSTRPERTSTDAEGRPIVESWGTLGSPGNRRRRPVRRIELRRPTGDPIVLVTDLDDSVASPAADLLAAYRDRHTIETVFQKATEVFGLERLIGGSPQAGLFQFAFCLLLHNIVQVLLGYVAEAKGRPRADLSAEKTFADVRDQLVAWHVVFTPDQTTAYYAERTDREGLQRRLRSILQTAWCPTWRASKAQPNRSPPHRGLKRSHSSVQRLLDAAAKRQP